MSWHNGIEYIDSLVKDYLAYRKLNNALKAFESDLKADKDKGFRVDKVVQYLLQMVHWYDIDGLVSYWRYLNDRFFSHFAKNHGTAVAKYEADLYRLYVVHCVQNSKQKELHAFFQKVSDLGNIPGLKDWYVLMFTSAQEKKSTFAPYFTRQWSETFIVSLHNFLAAVFSIMPEPDLVRTVREDGKRILELEQEIMRLKERLAKKDATLTRSESASSPTVSSYVQAMGNPGALKNSVQQSGEMSKKSASKPVLIRNSPISSKSYTAGSPSKSNSSTAASSSPKEQPRRDKETSKFSLFKKSASSSGITTTVINKPGPFSSPVAVADVSINSITAQSTTPLPNLPMLTRVPDADQSSTSPAEISYAKQISLEKSGDDEPSITGATTFPTVVAKVLPLSSKSALPSSSVHSQPLISTSSLFPQHNTRSPPTYQKAPFIVLSTDTFQEHHSSVVQCKFDNTGTTVASVETQGVVKVWQHAPTLKSLATLIMHNPVQCLEWCNKPTDTLLLGTSNGMIRFFDVARNVTVTDVIIDIAHCCLACIKTHPAGTSFVTSSVKPTNSEQKSDVPLGVVTVWDIATARVKQSRHLVGNSAFAVTCIDYNHNGNLLVTGDISGCITLYDMKTCNVIHSCQAHDGAVSFVQFSTDETLVYSFGADNELMAWNINYLQKEPIKFGFAKASGQLSSYNPSVQPHLVLSPDGKHALSSSGSKGLVYQITISPSSAMHVLSLPEHKSPVTALDWIASKSCGHCLTGSSDGKIQVATLLQS